MTDESGPFECGWVPIDHARIYWEASGNAAGVPVLYLHGGPGGSLGRGGYRQRHDAAQFWTVGIDQRGCGKSTPAVQDDLARLPENTTQRLIADIEAVREHLGIERWVVTGVSWGSTLALAYALEHPARVLGIALVAVTTTSRDEVDWITEGVGRVFPEAWNDFALGAAARPGERVVEAYARRLAGRDRDDARQAADDWDRWEATHVSLGLPVPPGPMIDDAEKRLAFATLVTHYLAQDGFLTGDAEILPRIHELDGIPGHLIHGRRDISGPVITAWKLSRRWRGSQLIVVEDEAHGGPKSMVALTRAVAEIAGARIAVPQIEDGPAPGRR